MYTYPHSDINKVLLIVTIRPGLSPSREKPHDRDTKNWKIVGFIRALREVETRSHGRQRDLRQAKPPGDYKELFAD